MLGCLFLSSFDNVPACLPPHISEPHLFFMQQTIYERLSRASVSSPARQPLPRRAASNARFFTFHFALRRSLATAQSKPFGAPIVSTFCSKAKGKRRAFSIEMLRVRNCAISAVCIGHGRPQNVFVRCGYTYSWCSHATFARECHPKVIVSQDNLGWRMRHAPGG